MKKIIFLTALAIASLFVLILACWPVVSSAYRAHRDFDISALHEMETATQVLSADGRLLGRLFLVERIQVPLSDVSPLFVKALIATEDRRYMEHSGVDYWGIARAAWANLRGGRVTQGASTITQQLARNSFSLKGRTVERKLIEAFLAQKIEKKLSKTQILELYCNRVYFGSGFYGIEAASQGYFGIRAKDLTLAQAALLASLLKSPNTLSPFNHPEASLRARNAVLRQMQEQGMISSSERRTASEEELPLVAKKSPKPTSHVVEMVRQELVSSLGIDQTLKGGLVVVTTVDSGLQTLMEESVRQVASRIEDRLPPKRQTYEDFDRRNDPKSTPEYLQASAVVLDNKNGAILALVGGRSFVHSEFNRATQLRRPPFGALSPIILLLAFENGVCSTDKFQDWPLDNKFVGLGGATGVLGEWGSEKRDNEYEGLISVREILTKGKVSAFARLGFVVGADKIEGFLSSLVSSKPRPSPPPSVALGTTQVSPLRLAQMYTLLPNEGDIPGKPFLVQKVSNAMGEVLFQAEPPQMSRWSVSKFTRVVHDMLSTGMSSGPAAKATKAWGLENQVAVGRPGTSYGFTDAWFAGYDSNISAAAWVGFDKPESIFYGAFGGDLAAPIWVAAMNWSWANTNPSPLSSPAREKVALCPVSGRPMSPGCPKPENSASRLSEYVLSADRLCTAHSMLSADESLSPSPWPRAAPALDLSRVRPVPVDTLQILQGADDPFFTSLPKISDVQVLQASPATTPPPSSLSPDSPAFSSSGSSPAPSGSPAPSPAPSPPPSPEPEPAVRALGASAPMVPLEDPVSLEEVSVIPPLPAFPTSDAPRDSSVPVRRALPAEG